MGGEARRRRQQDPESYGREGIRNAGRPGRSRAKLHRPSTAITSAAGIEALPVRRESQGVKVRVPVGEVVESTISVREQLEKAGIT